MPEWCQCSSQRLRRSTNWWRQIAIFKKIKNCVFLFSSSFLKKKKQQVFHQVQKRMPKSRMRNKKRMFICTSNAKKKITKNSNGSIKKSLKWKKSRIPSNFRWRAGCVARRAAPLSFVTITDSGTFWGCCLLGLK